MKNRDLLIWLFSFLIFVLGATAMAKDTPDLTAFMPDRLGEWKVLEKDRVFYPENLYEYIDGGAELYISYGFRSVFSRTYSQAEQPDIIVDLFDMGSSQNAFGVFSHARETIDDTFGQGSQYTEGLLLFWKDFYFVSILASPETPASRKAVFELARAIETAIPNNGPLPKLLDLLPEQDLVRESIRYFHHYIWLNSFYYVSDENILHINEGTDAVLAKYGKLGERSLLLLVEYQKGEDAKAGYGDFVKHYLPELSGNSAVQIEDGTWMGCRLEENLLVIVFNAPNEKSASVLLEAVAAK